MGALGTALIPDTLRSIDSATFTGSYQAVGTAFGFSMRIMKITNNSNVSVLISWNGVNDNEFLPAGSFILLDVSSNREIANICEISKGTQIYAKGSSGTGSLYVSTYYVRGS